MEALSAALVPALPRRTLQRRLALLVAQKQLAMEGDARATLYRIPVGAHQVASSAAGEYGNAMAEVAIPLSAEGQEIQAYVRQPRQLRKPVGYRIEFLEEYYPNHTFYLPQPLRTQLHAIGRSPVEQAAAGTFARDILTRLLIDLSWASSRLEGNTYSWLDTERLIGYGQAAEGKDATETQMILNHKEAIEYLARDAERVGVNPETIIHLHAYLSDGLMLDPDASGRLRRRPVGIGGSVYLPPSMPQHLEEWFGIIVGMAAEIADPFEQAFFLMVHLPYLQPFEDVNKRVSRLAANIPLIRGNLCPLSFIDVPQQDYVEAILGVYECNRIELLRDVFVWAYQRSCQQYVAVRRHLVPPDAFRLRFRNELGEAMRTVIQSGQPVNQATIQLAIPAKVGEADRERFVALVLQEFSHLHEGNAIRYGLRPLQYQAWKEGVDASPASSTGQS